MSKPTPIKVVQVSTGETQDMFVCDHTYNPGTCYEKRVKMLYRASQLRQDGMPDKRQTGAHLEAHMAFNGPRGFAVFHKVREEQATRLRVDIELLQEQLKAAQRALVCFYQETGGEP